METKTLQATPETLASVINSLVTPAQIDVPLATGALVRVYYRKYYTVQYYRANGEKKCDFDLLTKAEAINTAWRFVQRALHLWEPYLLLPNKAYYTPEMIGKFIIKARDTKHGIIYDIVRSIGFKMTNNRGIHIFRNWRFERVHSCYNYRLAYTMRERFNRWIYEKPILFRPCRGGVAVWLDGSRINNGNVNKELNASCIYNIKPQYGRLDKILMDF